MPKKMPLTFERRAIVALVLPTVPGTLHSWVRKKASTHAEGRRYTGIPLVLRAFFSCYLAPAGCLFFLASLCTPCMASISFPVAKPPPETHLPLTAAPATSTATPTACALLRVGETKSLKKKASGLSAERLVPRRKLPPLLVAAGSRNPERLHWLGASFGVTGPLLRLWKRAGFKLVYLRQTTSDLTGAFSFLLFLQFTCFVLPYSYSVHVVMRLGGGRHPASCLVLFACPCVCPALSSTRGVGALLENSAWDQSYQIRS